MRPLVLPNTTYFPDPFTGDEKSVRKLVRRMKKYAGMDDVPVKVRVLGLDESDSGARNSCCGDGCHTSTQSEHASSLDTVNPGATSGASSRDCGTGSCGRCDSAEQLDATEPRLVDLGDEWLVQIPASELKRDVILTTNIAKLIGLIFLLENLPQGARIEDPVDANVEIAGTVLGFGALLLEGSYLYSKSCGGPKISRATSLSCSELAILTALFVARGNHKSNALKSQLGTTQAAAYREAEVLIRANRQIVEKLATDAQQLMSGNFTLRNSIGLWERFFGGKSAGKSQSHHSDDIDIGELETMLASTPGIHRRSKARAADDRHDELRALVDDALAERAEEA